MSSSYSAPISESLKQIRILVADRNPMNSQLLAEALGRNPRFEITGIAAPEKISPLVPDLQPFLVTPSNPTLITTTSVLCKWLNSCGAPRERTKSRLWNGT